MSLSSDIQVQVVAVRNHLSRIETYNLQQNHLVDRMKPVALDLVDSASVLLDMVTELAEKRDLAEDAASHDIDDNNDD